MLGQRQTKLQVGSPLMEDWPVAIDGSELSLGRVNHVPRIAAAFDERE